MEILKEKTPISKFAMVRSLKDYPDFIKAVADVEREVMAVNAIMHADLKHMLILDGSKNENLYGFTVARVGGEIDYHSVINIARNKDAGYFENEGDGDEDTKETKKEKSYVKDPVVREKIKKIVEKWLTIDASPVPKAEDGDAQIVQGG